MAANFQSVFFLQISDPAKRSALCAIAQLLREARFNLLAVSAVSPLISSPSEIRPLCLISHVNVPGAPLQSHFPRFNHPAWGPMSTIVADGQFAWLINNHAAAVKMCQWWEWGLEIAWGFPFLTNLLRNEGCSFLPLASYGSAQTLWACTGKGATLESQDSKEHFAPTASQMAGQTEAPIRQSLSWPIRQTLPRSFSHWISYFCC